MTGSRLPWHPNPIEGFPPNSVPILPAMSMGDNELIGAINPCHKPPLSNGFASLPPANHQSKIHRLSVFLRLRITTPPKPRIALPFLFSNLTRHHVEHLPPNFTRFAHHLHSWDFSSHQIRLWPTFLPTVGSMCHAVYWGGRAFPIFGCHL